MSRDVLACIALGLIVGLRGAPAVAAPEKGQAGPVVTPVPDRPESWPDARCGTRTVETPSGNREVGKEALFMLSRCTRTTQVDRRGNQVGAPQVSCQHREFVRCLK